MNRAGKGSRLARQIAGRAGLQMAALNLALFVLFGAVYLAQGVRLQLLGPLEQARDRLVRKLEDGELALAAPPAQGLPEEPRFLRTLERDGLDLTVVLENDRAVWYDEQADEMTEGALAAPFVPGDEAPGIRLRTAPGHGWMAVAGARVEDPAGGSALVLAALPLRTLGSALQPMLAMLALSTLAAVLLTHGLSRRLSRQLVRPLQAMEQALARWWGEQYDPPEAAPTADELGELRNAMEQTARQLEQARDRRKKEDEDRRVFFADISHELKTPLAVLRAQAELMRDGMLEAAEVPAQTVGMLTELEQLQTVVQDLLTLARMQAPGYSLERQVCSLRAILLDAGRSLTQLARKQGVRFVLELPDPDPLQDRVLTHYDRMRQLVMILGENGVKYTRPGGQAGMRLEYAPDGPVVLVWDQGTGIPAEEQGRVFDRFYRGGEPHRHRRRGAGPGHCPPAQSGAVRAVAAGTYRPGGQPVQPASAGGGPLLARPALPAPRRTAFAVPYGHSLVRRMQKGGGISCRRLFFTRPRKPAGRPPCRSAGWAGSADHRRASCSRFNRAFASSTLSPSRVR